MKQADIRAVSAKARARGIPQGGTLGSGNHFLEFRSSARSTMRLLRPHSVLYRAGSAA